MNKDGIATITQICSLTIFIAIVCSNKRIAINAINLQDTRFFIIVVVKAGNFHHAVYNFCNGLTLYRCINDRDILDDIVRSIQGTALIKLQVFHLVIRGVSTINSRFDISVPRLVVQEVIAVRNELLIRNLEFSGRFISLDGIFFLLTAILGCNRRELPIAKFPVCLDTEKALMVFRITGKFSTRKREVCRTGFNTLQDVIFKFALERFFVNDANFVLRSEAFIHVLDFNRDVRSNLTLDHEARVVVQGRRRPKTRLGAPLGIVLFAIALEADIHGALEHEFRLVKTEVLHPGRHVHRDRNIEYGTRFRRFVTAIVLPDKAIQPEALTAHIVHVRNVICQFRIMRCPEHRRIRTGYRIHALFSHVDFTGGHINIVRENLPLRSIHQPRTHANAPHREEAVERGCRLGHRDILDCRGPFL